MEVKVLNDASVVPSDEIVFSIIGEKEGIWKQTMSYLHDHYDPISEAWNYYKDGKSWMLKILRKKKTVCWIIVLEDTFRIAFWFAEKLEPILMESNLADELKDQYRKAKAYNRSRAIYMDVKNPEEINQIKRLIDLKMETL